MSEIFVRPQQTPLVFIGAGSVSAIGKTAQETHKALLEKRSGIREIGLGDIYPVAYIAEISGKSEADILQALYVSGVMALIDFPLEGTSKDDDRFIQLAQMSTREALENSGILEDGMLRADLQKSIGINIGNGIGGIGTIEDGALRLSREPLNSRPVRGKYITSLLGNLASGKIGDQYRIRGSSSSSNAACASGGYSLLEIANAIEAGQLEGGVVGGAESAARTLLGTSFDWMMGKKGALSRDWKKHVSADRALQAFGLNRDGFVIGEGAASQVILTRERADALNIPHTTELLGIVGHACIPSEENQSIANATAEGQVACIRKALMRANIQPNQVKAAYLHLTGTQAGDKNESAAIREVFQENVPVLTGNKSYIGHTLGAAFSLSLSEVITSFGDGMMNGIPTGKENIAPEFSDLPIAHEPFPIVSGDIVLINAFGFGGQNVTAIVRKV